TSRLDNRKNCQRLLKNIGCVLSSRFPSNSTCWLSKIMRIPGSAGILGGVKYARSIARNPHTSDQPGPSVQFAAAADFRFGRGGAAAPKTAIGRRIPPLRQIRV